MTKSLGRLKTRHVSLEVPMELHAAVLAYAVAEDRTIASAIRRLIMAGLRDTTAAAPAPPEGE